MSEIWSLFTYEMVQPNLVRGFLLSRRERNITVNENRDSTTSQRRGSGARGKGQMCSQNHSQVWTWQLVHGCLNFSLHLRSRCLLEWGGTRQAPRNISFTDESWNRQSQSRLLWLKNSKQLCLHQSYKTLLMCTHKGTRSTRCISLAWANAGLWFISPLSCSWWQLLS